MQKLTINKSFILNSIFCFFPISFILGNLVINLNIFILALLTVTLFLKEILKLKFNSLDKLLFLFFSFTLISLIINYTEHFILDKIFPKIIFIKTIFFIKYLILYIILRFLISKNVINVNLFKAICAICTLIVSVDIIFQFVNGKNIINMVPHFSTHYSGFFGKELIAGGYIQKFSLFIFFLPFFLKEKNFFKTIIQLILFLIILFSIILSGNRMSLVLFLVVASFVFFIFLKKKNFF